MIRNAEELLIAAQKHGLRLSPDNVKLDESGVDFLVAHARDEDCTTWMVRCPRRLDVIESATTENRALGLVRRHLPVAVPEWKIYSPEIIAYPKLDGTPAASIDTENPQYIWYIDQQSPADKFIDSLDAVLAALHTINHSEVIEAGLRVLSPSESRQSLAQNMDKTRSMLGVSDFIWRRWQMWLNDDTYWPEHSALVHGDMHPGHMLVDEYHRLIGLLDWTEAHVTDPATDFVIYFATLGDSALTALLKRYEEAGGRMWPRMHEHIVEMYSAYPVTIATFVLTTGEETHLELAKTMLAMQEQ
jgi:macrolide phosphotransferase